MKKNILCLAFAAFSWLSVLSAGNLKETEKIYLKSGELSASQIRQLPFSVAPEASELVNGRFYRLIRFSHALSDVEMEAVASSGIRLLNYIPYYSWFASLPAGISAAQLSGLAVEAVLPVTPDMKLHRFLSGGAIPAHAVPSAGQALLNVQPYGDINPSVAMELIRSAGFEILSIQKEAVTFRIQTTQQQIQQLASLPVVRYLEPVSPPSEPEDTRGRSLHRSNAINTMIPAGMHYDGDSVAISLADDGEVGPHIDFQGRMITIMSGGPGGNHGDMTSGIAVGAGNLNPTIAGMASGATILIHDINDGPDGYDHIYSSPGYYSLYNAVITSTSYSQGCNDYNSITQTSDGLAYANPQLTYVFSAGNRGTGDCNYGAGSPWGTITGGMKIGKNVIACANLDAFEVLDNTSSRGPADDGRVKPDIAANGADQLSTDESNTYQVGGGTSAACPGIAGVSAQLYDAFKQMNGGQEPEAALIKAVLLNSAQDIGNPGPDYTYGFGRVNALRAVNTITEQRFHVDSLSQGDSLTFSISVPPGKNQLKAMIYWLDSPGDPLATFQLVHDLDLTITDPSSNVLLPLVLNPTPNPSALSAPAVPGIDRLNNVEQVVVDVPAAGTYVVSVKGFSVPLGVQKYYIVWDIIDPEITLTYPFGGEGFVPSEDELIRWDAYGSNGSFLIEYSANNGASWNNIATVPGSERQHQWIVPNTVSDQVIIRVSRGADVDMNNTPISILNLPQNLQVDYTCPDTLQLSWNAVSGATAYQVYRLGAKYMDSVAVTSGTTVRLAVPSNTTEWFSVAAIGPNGGKGRRANAIEKTPGLLNCSLANDLSLENAISPTAGTVYPCQPLNAVPLTVEVRNLGFQPVTSFDISYTVNGGTPVTETYTGTLVQGAAVIYTFASTLNLSLPGSYNISFEINQAGDQNVLNNILPVAVVTGMSAALPLSEDFQSGFPPAGWQIVPTSTTYQWTGRAGTIGSNGNTTVAAWFDNFSYNNNGAEDPLVMMLTNFTGTTSPLLTFDVAYSQYGASYNDGLRVDISTDCGQTFVPTGYLKLGGDLATTTETGSDWYPSDASEWRNDSIDLSMYAGQPAIIRFVNINDFGNNLLLDNISLIDNTLTSVKESVFEPGLTVWPNPSKGEFSVAGYGLSGRDLTLTIIDAQGRLVISKPVTAANGTILERIDVAHLPAGIYSCRIQSDEGVTSVRVVLQ